ncbi:MAG: CBM96 family carbohydrate-binding protein, partial [Promethearchaeota archaeon]
MKPINFNKNLNFLFLILIFSLSVCAIDQLGIVNLTVTARDEHEPHDDWQTVNMDSFISERLKDSNYGDDSYLKIGDAISGQNITYFYFNLLSYDTSSAKRADLYIYVTSVPQETLLSVHVADSNTWNEDSITWNNAPTYGNSIAQKSVSSTGFIIFDVSSVLIVSNLPEITLIITTEGLSSVRIRSKENIDTRMEDEFPHIIFIRDIVPGFDIFITLFLISTAITLIGIKLKKNK